MPRNGSICLAGLVHLQLAGFVPDACLKQQPMPPISAIEQLVRVGLWRRMRGGYRVQDSKMLLDEFEIQDFQREQEEPSSSLGAHVSSPDYDRDIFDNGRCARCGFLLS